MIEKEKVMIVKLYKPLPNIFHIVIIRVAYLSRLKSIQSLETTHINKKRERGNLKHCEFSICKIVRNKPLGHFKVVFGSFGYNKCLKLVNLLLK